MVLKENATLVLGIIVVLGLLFIGLIAYEPSDPLITPEGKEMPRFASGEELILAFKDASLNYRNSSGWDMMPLLGKSTVAGISRQITLT